MMSEEKDPKIIEGSPTKELFIEMLVRDIPLIRSIIDLVDNSVDGATRNQINDNYDDFRIRIEVKKEYFKISDNCGGIPIDVARDYAFRFGRPKDVPLTPKSIGKFGVGMKRTFFKLGKQFIVDSTTETSHFVVEHDVDEWKATPDWHFKFKKLEENLSNRGANQIGTVITIQSLHQNVSENFELENFITRLQNELETAHSIKLNKGLIISLNGLPLGVRHLSLLQSDKLKPAYFKKVYHGGTSDQITVKIYVGVSERGLRFGVSERGLREGGWYIFCNGRMLLEADQSKVTGWDENNIPKYHPDFAFFRGFVFFDSDDAELLPWTTTKTGIDTDSEIFRAILHEMNTLMRPVLDFLRKLETERRKKEIGEIESSPLDEELKKSKIVNYSDIKKLTLFVAPKSPPRLRGPNMSLIMYSKPDVEIDKIKKILKLTSKKAVGEETFEYFKKMECDE